MKEKTIEVRLVNGVKKLGGKAYKFTSPSNRSVPDRLCIFPGGKMVFVEVKAPGKKPTPLQELTIENLRKMGAEVLVMDSIDGVNSFLELMEKED